MKHTSPLHDQSYRFAVRIIEYHRNLVRLREFILGKQILKSGTSIGANIHESIQAQSRNDYISKLSIALKEAEETDFWLRLFAESKILTKETLTLREELRGILKMLISAIKTLKNQR